MPRIRTVKPEFWDSPDTAAADLRTRLLYIAMWNWADDYGIGDATPVRLIGFAFPHDDIPAADYPRLIADVSRAFKVVFFRHAGRRYYVIPAWDEHQRTEKKAKPKEGLVEAAQSAAAAGQPANAERPQDSADSPPPSEEPSAPGKGTGEQGNRGTGEVEAPRKRGSRLTEGWMPSQESIATMRAECPRIDLEAEHRKFHDHWKAKTGKDATKLDWDATWRNWIRSARTPQTPRSTSAVDDKVNGWLEMASTSQVRELE